MLVEINLTQETAYKHNLQRMLRSVRMFCGFTQGDTRPSSLTGAVQPLW